MHWSIPEQGRWLLALVKGYFAHHAVPNTNSRPISALLYRVAVL
jgi:hypothetical protein